MPHAGAESAQPGPGSLADRCVQVLLDVPHWAIPRSFFASLPSELANDFLARLLEAYPYPQLPAAVVEKFGPSASALRIAGPQAHKQQLQYVAAAVDFRWLASLHVAHLRPDAAALLWRRSASLAASLQVLELPGFKQPHRSKAPPRFLAALTSLHRLDLQDCELPGEWLEDVATLRGLTHLNLAQARLRGEAAPASFAALSSLQGLRHLDMNGASAAVPIKLLPKSTMQVFAGEGLRALTALTRLTFLDLSGTAADFLPDMASLQDLSLRTLNLTNASQAPLLPALTRLELHSAGLPAATAELLLLDLLGPAKPRLQHLGLATVARGLARLSEGLPYIRSDQPAGELRVPLLAEALTDAPALTHLDLTGAILRRADLAAMLRCLVSLPALRTLILSGSDFVGPAFQLFRVLPASLRRLDMNAVGDTAAGELPHPLADGTLWYPHNVSDRLAANARGLPPLPPAPLGLTQLTRLALSGCPIARLLAPPLAGGGLGSGVNASRLRRLELVETSLHPELLASVVAAAPGIEQLLLCDASRRLLRPPGAEASFSLALMEQEAAYVQTIARLRRLRLLRIGCVAFVSSLAPLGGLPELEDFLILAPSHEFKASETPADKLEAYMQTAVKSGWPSLRRYTVRQHLAGMENAVTVRPEPPKHTGFTLSRSQAPAFAAADERLWYGRQQLLALRARGQAGAVRLPAELQRGPE